jgi:hypothetical protein
VCGEGARVVVGSGACLFVLAQSHAARWWLGRDQGGLAGVKLQR